MRRMLQRGVKRGREGRKGGGTKNIAGAREEERRKGREGISDLAYPRKKGGREGSSAFFFPLLFLLLSLHPPGSRGRPKRKRDEGGKDPSSVRHVDAAVVFQ